MLIVSDDMIADMESNKLFVTELFLRGFARNVLLAFVSQIYFKVPKTIRLNAAIILSSKFLTKDNFNK